MMTGGSPILGNRQMPYRTAACCHNLLPVRAARLLSPVFVNVSPALSGPEIATAATSSDALQVLMKFKLEETFQFGSPDPAYMLVFLHLNFLVVATCWVDRGVCPNWSAFLISVSLVIMTSFGFENLKASKTCISLWWQPHF